MVQICLNHVAIFHGHENVCQELDLNDITCDFIHRTAVGRNTFQLHDVAFHYCRPYTSPLVIAAAFRGMQTSLLCQQTVLSLLDGRLFLIAKSFIKHESGFRRHAI
jgi:hypothetical protein